MKITTLLGHLWLLVRDQESGPLSIWPSTVWKGLYYDDCHLLTLVAQQALERDEDEFRAELAEFLDALSAGGLLEKRKGLFNAVCPGCSQEQEIKPQGDMATCAFCSETSPLGGWSAEHVYTIVRQVDQIVKKSVFDEGAAI